MKILKSLMLLSFLSASCFAKDIKLTENENKFSITTKSITGFDFVNQLSEINTSKIKKMTSSLLSSVLTDMEKMPIMVCLFTRP